MAIVQMQKLSICANKKHRKEILEFLQNLGTFEVITDEIDDPELKKKDTSSACSQYLKSADSFDQALKVMSEYFPEKGGGISSLTGREEITRDEMNRVITNNREYLEDAAQILKDKKEITECEGVILKDNNQITSLQPWKDLGIPMSYEGTKETKVFLGTIPDPLGADELYAKASKDLAEPAGISADILSTAPEQSCIAVICLKKDSDKVEENLRSIGFTRPSQMVTGVPADEIRALEEDIAANEKRIAELKDDISCYTGRRKEYRIASDYFRSRAAKYKVLGQIPQSENAFFMEGWVPAGKVEQISKILSERFGALVEKEEIREGEEEPTLLRNNPFSAAAEGVLASYGLPRRGHVDPTFIMSIFYVIFFGMMLSDAGYGIVMFVGCAVALLKFPNMEKGMKKMIRLFFWCGLSTTFWGMIYGGFFGDAIDVIAKTFFGYTGNGIVKALWFEPLKEPMRLLVWCMFFGVIHLYTGLGIKGYEYLSDKDIVGFVCDIVSWYMFLTGLILILLPSDLFTSISGMTFVFPPFVGTLAKVLALGGLVIILLMSGRSNKNWALRIALGAYDLYGVTSWLSDVLSYSRLLALGLATGVIANVINMMCQMVAGSGGIIGAILFTIVFLLGHTLNIGINALGAYVHTNRLQYVEFFGKFYEGGGRPFVPFQTANQYVEVKEEKSL